LKDKDIGNIGDSEEDQWVLKFGVSYPFSL